ncbi:hypothetical protein [Streptomyces sp. NPDC048527]
MRRDSIDLPISVFDATSGSKTEISLSTFTPSTVATQSAVELPS